MDRAAVSSPATVLVVEDEALISEMISDALRACGFRVHAVADAGDALCYLDAGAPVDVLFTDINLPGGIDGATLAQRARAIRPDLPIVFASGRWSVLEGLRAISGTACLTKPYSATQACAAVEQLIAPQCAGSVHRPSR